MAFNSFTFFAFLLIVFALHYSRLSWRQKKINLIAASYLFYAAWNPPFVILLWISTLVDWFVARRIDTAELTKTRRLWVCASLAVNLGLLASFKYGTFLLDNFALLLEALDISYKPPAPSIILPVGISFYTFQTLSYTLDIYHRRARPWGSFVDYALYVTFFPQLVAGPIVRSREFLPQCVEPRRATAAQFGWGLVLLTVGLFQKVVVADAILAPVAEHVYDSQMVPNFWSAWYGTLAFAGQIFCDFSGYSSCAIGVAMCLEFKIPDNFRAPYAAIGFSDFWSRWHISLSTWLRDYLYIPLGGNRLGNLRTHLNLLLTMLIGGLWHGASWTFVFWGGLHGVYLVVERLIRTYLFRNADSKRLSASVEFPLMIGTFLLVCFTWVFFRAKTFGTAFTTILSMLGLADDDAISLVGTLDGAFVVVVVGALVASHWILRGRTFEDVVRRVPWWITAVALAMMMVAIFTSPGEDRAFIYFQF